VPRPRTRPVAQPSAPVRDRPEGAAGVIPQRRRLLLRVEQVGRATLPRVSDDATTPPRVHASIDVHADVDASMAYTLTTTEAAAILGRSEGTVRRLIRTGHLPAVETAGERTTEYRLRAEDVHDIHGRVNAYTTRRVRDRGRVTRVDASPAEPGEPVDAHPARVDATIRTAGMQALIDQAIVSATAPLAAELAEARRTIERLAVENGTLAERLRALDVAQPPTDAPPAPVAPEPIPAPRARPAPSVGARLLRWLRS